MDKTNQSDIPFLNISPFYIHSWGFADVENWNYNEEQTHHELWHCYINDRSGGYLCNGLQKIPLEPLEVYLIAPGTFFSTSSSHKFKQLYFMFSVNWFGKQPVDRIFSLPIWQEAENFFNTLKKNYNKRSFQQNCEAFGFLHTAISKLPKKFFTQENADPRLEVALRKIHSSGYRGRFSNRQLAENINMSENGFIQFFTKHIGKSPQQYYREMRIKRACQLLRTTSAGIEDIAKETGFIDRYHLSRVFSKQMGISPGKYRHNDNLKNK